jgi:hypothetical protein
MRIIIGCEYSQIVTLAFRAKGHEAYSCDIIPCEGGHPEWHFQEDILEILKREKFDMGIFHPPCTYLTVTANRWLKNQPARKSGKKIGAERRLARKEGMEFFLALWNVSIKKIAIENPIGCMSKIIGKPSQIIHPYYWGDATTKATCLWLKNLPCLTWNKEDDLFGKKTIIEPEIYTSKTGKKYPKWSMIDACKIKDLDERSHFRSKTFPGIANAMAEQWSNLT